MAFHFGCAYVMIIYAWFNPLAFLPNSIEIQAWFGCGSVSWNLPYGRWPRDRRIRGLSMANAVGWLESILPAYLPITSLFNACLLSAINIWNQSVHLTYWITLKYPLDCGRLSHLPYPPTLSYDPPTF